MFCVSYIYILNTHLCTFWYQFCFLQGGPGEMGVRWWKGEVFGGNSTFLIALCWWRGGGGSITKRWLHPSSVSAHTQSLILCGIRWRRKKNSAVRGQAYRMSRKVQDTRSSGTSSLGPKPKAVVRTSTISYLGGKKLGVGSEKGWKQGVIHIFKSIYSHVATEHKVIYLCFHPCLLLLTSLAFGVLHYCIWPQRPGRETIHSEIRQLKSPQCGVDL